MADTNTDNVPRMGFFSTIHRSVLDPQFFVELRGYSFFKAVRYLLLLVLFGSIISGIAHSAYFLDPQKGFAPRAAAAFKDLRIENGRLVPARQTPYVPDQSALRELMILAVGMPELIDVFPDSLVIIDTAATAADRRHPGTLAVFTSTSLVLYPTASFAMKVPYDAVFGSNAGVLFDAETISAKLRRHPVTVAMQFVVQDGLLCFLNAFLSVVFMVFAAFILNFRTENRWRYSIVASIYATTPVVLGGAIAAISGTHVRGIWYFFMILASIVLFRGIRRNMPPDPMPPTQPI